MKLASASASPIDIRLTATVPTGAGGIGDRGGLRLLITTDSGAMGLGETAPIPGVDGPGIEDLAEEVNRWADHAVDLTLDDALLGLDDVMLTPLARFCVHTALIDLASAANGMPLAQYLRTGASDVVRLNALVAEANPATIHSRVADLVREGFSAVKLKVGSQTTTEDVTRIIAASEAAGTGVALRLDANGAWDAETAERVIGRVGKHRISYLEDPTPNPSEFSELQQTLDVPIAVDIGPTQDPQVQIDAASVGVVVVKPAAIGGVDRVLDLARANPDRTIVLSSSIDREIALAAAIHAAAALPGEPMAHGLATGGIVRNMPAALLPAGGTVSVPSGPGVYRPEQTSDEP